MSVGKGDEEDERVGRLCIRLLDRISGSLQRQWIKFSLEANVLLKPASLISLFLKNSREAHSDLLFFDEQFFFRPTPSKFREDLKLEQIRKTVERKQVCKTIFIETKMINRLMSSSIFLRNNNLKNDFARTHVLY